MFFNEAVGGKLRENYETEEDLAGIKDKTLLDTCSIRINIRYFSWIDTSVYTVGFN